MQVAVLPRRYDAKIGTANSLQASAKYGEYNERLGLFFVLFLRLNPNVFGWYILLGSWVLFLFELLWCTVRIMYSIYVVLDVNISVLFR